MTAVAAPIGRRDRYTAVAIILPWVMALAISLPAVLR
jgi:hypothetical protein